MSILRTLLYPLSRFVEAIRRIIIEEPRAYVRRTVIVLFIPPYLIIFGSMVLLVLLSGAVQGLMYEWKYHDPLQVFSDMRNRWNGVGVRKVNTSNRCALCSICDCPSEDECKLR